MMWKDGDQLFSPEELCAYMGGPEPLTPQILERWRRDGSGPPFIQDGDAVRYKRSDLAAWIAENLLLSVRSD